MRLALYEWHGRDSNYYPDHDDVDDAERSLKQDLSTKDLYECGHAAT